ncbi:hypothetical protein [Agriterribacter sp.]|uniref:hypothetical protein n=1 Tax=Agriterribacter sp. TaxID=2821509 RepID=UPI002CF87D2A|nr:hypothetical protein [Agriterribacter sp.]HRO47330.1 hypothetical protein [Agriterribacter sp.]HRQ18161.1 hypothetical protein [Agriterribacter sp.]
MAGNKTSFKKGQGGRKPGAPNKATKDLRQWINSFIDSQTEQIQKDWKQLEPKDRIILFERLLKYSLPTLQATSLTTDFEKMTDQQLDQIIDELKKQSDENI